MAGHRIDPKAVEAHHVRNAADVCAWKASKLGSSGPASACVRLDPVTGQASLFMRAAGIATARPGGSRPMLRIHPVSLAASTIATERPSIGQPKCFEELKQKSVVKRVSRPRRRVGGAVPRIRLTDINQPVNASTARSRKKRRIDRLSRSDPLSCYRVWLPNSTVAKIIVGLEPVRPEDRNLEITEAAWNQQFSRVLRRLIEDAIKTKK
ncbi:hypothetical protein HU230_0006380 [Bradyrhizobium quebecense]|uniref:Uncharacterized protein n=1 Tax=Bradyrhizobium quebecense TaxID=2748629 RepID=A0A973WVG3_9BRAD|nr:hypothetical protein [Bradyrhizobium quebecense]UGA45662.1 hypothetical protein HU230_0006380 [Bradyrhizobium quebecense]